MDRLPLRTTVHQVLDELRKQIPERSYRIFYLHWIEGRTMADIAALLKLPIEQVWTRHRGANHKFQSLFDMHTNQRLPPD